jgi:hypothetical protein
VSTSGAGSAAQAKDGKAAGAPKLLGTTLVATGSGSTGLKVKTGATTVIRNSVVRGVGEDVSVYSNSSASVDHSNFRPAFSARYTDAGASPVAGERVNVAPVTGTVKVRPRGGDGFVPLEAGASVPVDSVVDATDGVVTITSETRSGGEPQTGRFWGGRFRVVQSADGDAYTTLVLTGGGFRRACSAGTGTEKVGAARSRRVRRLWGRDHGGRFRTKGRRGQATVRGTAWLTADRCDGTLFKVRKGAISVKAKGERRRKVLRAGERYLAR